MRHGLEESVLITGVGKINATKTLEESLQEVHLTSDLVINCSTLENNRIAECREIV